MDVTGLLGLQKITSVYRKLYSLYHAHVCQIFPVCALQWHTAMIWWIMYAISVQMFILGANLSLLSWQSLLTLTARWSKFFMRVITWFTIYDWCCIAAWQWLHSMLFCLCLWFLMSHCFRWKGAKRRIRIRRTCTNERQVARCFHFFVFKT